MLFGKVIDNFSGDFSFLSNFFDVYERFAYAGNRWDTAEHAYQAMKTLDREWQEKVRRAKTPGQAKRMTYLPEFPLRPDWDKVKREIMYRIVVAKFTQNPKLMAQLKATGDATLIEGNTWHDNIWGICSCKACMFGSEKGHRRGQNWLGLILMNVRNMEVVE